MLQNIGNKWYIQCPNLKCWCSETESAGVLLIAIFSLKNTPEKLCGAKYANKQRIVVNFDQATIVICYIRIYRRLIIRPYVQLHHHWTACLSLPRVTAAEVTRGMAKQQARTAELRCAKTEIHGEIITIVAGTKFPANKKEIIQRTSLLLLCIKRHLTRATNDIYFALMPSCEKIGAASVWHTLYQTTSEEDTTDQVS